MSTQTLSETKHQLPEPAQKSEERSRQVVRYRAAVISGAIRVSVLIGAGLVWEVIARWLSPTFIPPMSEILTNAWSQWVVIDGIPRLSSDFRGMVVASFARLVPGLVWGIVAGITLGVLVARVRWMGELFGPLFQFIRAIPSSAKIPLFMALLGIGDSMKISVIALGVALPLLMNTADGVRNVDPTLMAMSKVYRVGTWQRLTRIVLPAASPQIFAGLRIATTIALIVLVLTELTGASSGVGHYVNYAQSQFLVLDMWAGVLLLGFIGYILNVILTLAENRVLRWQRESTATTV